VDPTVKMANPNKKRICTKVKLRILLIVFIIVLSKKYLYKKNPATIKPIKSVLIKR
jgi:hypothetical protein